MTVATYRRGQSVGDLSNETFLMQQALNISQSPSAPLPDRLCVQDPPYMNLGRASSSAPVTKQEAALHASNVSAFVKRHLATASSASSSSVQSQGQVGFHSPIFSALSSDLRMTPSHAISLEALEMSDTSRPQPMNAEPISRSAFSPLKTRTQVLTPVYEQADSTLPALHRNHPHLATMDLSTGERLDEEPPTFRTLGPVDGQFIKDMVEQHQMSEQEATLKFYCRKWAQLHGFDLNPL